MAMIEALFLQHGGPSPHRAPSLDVFGSYFPAWLLSLAAGAALTILASAAGSLLGIKPSGFLRPLPYVSLILIFSISVWFWLFAI
jgi:hypothetical protein